MSSRQRAIQTFLAGRRAVAKTIRHVMARAAGRRIILVAYVGEDAIRLLGSDVSGITVYCWDAPGATSASGVQQLIAAGAQVYFVTGLHQKIYWSAHRGCVVASANLSASALEAAATRYECGVYFRHSAAIDIDRQVHAFLEARMPDAATMRALERVTPHGRRGRRRTLPAVSFDSWAAHPIRTVHLVPYYEAAAHDKRDFSAIATQRDDVDTLLEAKHRLRESVSVPAGTRVGDWLLTFRHSETDELIGRGSWLRADVIATVAGELRAYELDRKTTPPFVIDANASVRLRAFFNSAPVARRRSLTRKAGFRLDSYTLRRFNLSEPVL